MKALLRTLGFLAFLLAFVLLVVDGTTIISDKAFSFTSVGELVTRAGAPGVLERWSAAVSRALHPAIWSVFNALVLSAPAVVVASILGVAALLAGRRSEPELSFGARN